MASSIDTYVQIPFLPEMSSSEYADVSHDAFMLALSLSHSPCKLVFYGKSHMTNGRFYIRFKDESEAIAFKLSLDVNALLDVIRLGGLDP